MEKSSVQCWLDYLEELHPKGQGGVELGLERVKSVKTALNQLQRCPLIIVGGTNGKGSTCAYLESIYRQAGYSVGCYTSPHLIRYNERIKVNGQAVDDLVLCKAFSRVDAAMKASIAENLTFFEFGTLAAWEVFSEYKIDIIILEVGLGGRLDAVNAYDADCTIVTGIALDHMEWLGSTRECIGREKAGIFRTGKPAFYSDFEAPDSLLNYARQLGADLYLIGRDFGYSVDIENRKQWSFFRNPDNKIENLPKPSLEGDFQYQNAAVAVAVVSELNSLLPVSGIAIRHGLVGATLPGRFQVISKHPMIILDVAHNPQAMSGVAANLQRIGKEGKTIAVIGMLADKDIFSTLFQLKESVDLWLLAGLKVSRGASKEDLAAFLLKILPEAECICFGSPEEAFESAAKLAGCSDKILITGSFYTVAPILRRIETRNDAEILK